MEQIYKILHVPTGLYATGHQINGGSLHKKGIKEPHTSMSKKGRAWKRYCDILAAWQTITKGFKEKRRPELLNDYRVVSFELVVVEMMTDVDLQEDIAIKNARYQKRKLEQDKSNLEYRLFQAAKDYNRYKDSMPKLNKKLRQ